MRPRKATGRAGLICCATVNASRHLWQTKPDQTTTNTMTNQVDLRKQPSKSVPARLCCALSLSSFQRRVISRSQEEAGEEEDDEESYESSLYCI